MFCQVISRKLNSESYVAPTEDEVSAQPILFSMFPLEFPPNRNHPPLAHTVHFATQLNKIKELFRASGGLFADSEEFLSALNSQNWDDFRLFIARFNDGTPRR